MASEREWHAKAEREAKLADALRANLRRRKAQARAAADDDVIGAPAKESDPVDGTVDGAT